MVQVEQLLTFPALKCYIVRVDQQLNNPSQKIDQEAKRDEKGCRGFERGALDENGDVQEGDNYQNNDQSDVRRRVIYHDIKFSG